MPFGSRLGRLGQWWKDRSYLEQILIIVTLIATIIIIILLARSHHKTKPEEKKCTTPVCLRESASILERVNPNINPCDDFYNFTCANVMINNDEDEVIDARVLTKQLMLELYKEPVRDDEHKVLKAVKNLFQACMDEKQIENDHLKVIKTSMEKLGGWPLLEGENWDEANFDWIKTTYKLRELGHYSRIFLDLIPIPGTKKDTKNILLISPPVEVQSFHYALFNMDTVAVMQEVAVTFGVEKNDAVMSQLTDVHNFLQEILKYDNPLVTYLKSSAMFKKCTVEDCQQSCPQVQWLEFINNIVGPTVKISKDDVLLFYPVNNLTNWLEFISKTPKRTQANYMIWRLIEESAPFLIEKLNKNIGNLWRNGNREIFCLKEIEEKFTSAPINVMVNRKYISVEKKQKLEEMNQNIKLQLTARLNSIDWMDKTDKQRLLDKVKTVKLIIAIPDNYLDDKVLDEFDVDLIETKDKDFLSLIAQANRNQISISFGLLKGPIPIGYTKTILSVVENGLPLYIQDLNALFISAVTTKKNLFNEKRPHYLNYGSMGYIVGKHLIEAIYNLVTEDNNVWSNKTKQGFLNKKKCLENKAGDDKFNPKKLTIQDLLYHTVGETVSYLAYEKWSEKNGKEQELIAVPYTSKKLFWISLASTRCQPIATSRLISLAIGGNKDFRNDFDCPVNSKGNYLKECHVL